MTAPGGGGAAGGGAGGGGAGGGARRVDTLLEDPADPSPDSRGQTLDAASGLDETLDAGAAAARATVPGRPQVRRSRGGSSGSSPARSGSGSSSGAGSALRSERQRVIESPEQDLGELPQVDPESYVHGYEVARGGMGRIVAARDRRLRRVVAIKELIHHTADRAARFEREALITARLQHPSIVNLHEAGRWPGGQPFYAMKLVSGRSLGEVVAEPLAQGQRMALLPNLLQMAEAIGYAHQQRIIHRDLKPSNVLIGELGETVVIDWGLAKDSGRGERRRGSARGRRRAADWLPADSDGEAGRPGAGEGCGSGRGHDGPGGRPGRAG